MSLSLLSNYSAVRDTGLTVPFGATGGTAPYVYSVAAGGAGGTINSSTGLYTSPIGTTGLDRILVTDGSAAVASGSIAVGIPIQLVANIIEKQLNIPGQVWLYQQKINIPNDSRAYITVGVRSRKAFANRPAIAADGVTAVQSVNVNETLSVDIFSRSTLPLSAVDAIMMGMSSAYAESMMELNSFYVAALPLSILNISGIDGPDIPYHLQLSLNLQYFSTLNTSVPYFENFAAPVITPDS